MTEQIQNHVKKAKKLALVGMTLGVIGTLMGLGGLVLRRCVPDVPNNNVYERIYEGKPTRVLYNNLGGQTQVVFGDYHGTDYWNINGEGTFEELGEGDKRIYGYDSKYKELNDKFNNIIRYFNEQKPK